MNYLGASPRGIKKANAQGESGTDPRVGVLNQKENKGGFSSFLKFLNHQKYRSIISPSETPSVRNNWAAFRLY